MAGVLDDPYTATTIDFQQGKNTSSAIQIDHVVALSDAWQTGAQDLSVTDREQLANDSVNLLAVDGPANQQKSDADAATWLPSNKDYRCTYVSKQIDVKAKYHLWVKQAEKDAMIQALGNYGATLPEKIRLLPQQRKNLPRRRRNRLLLRRILPLLRNGDQPRRSRLSKHLLLLYLRIVLRHVLLEQHRYMQVAQDILLH